MGSFEYSALRLFDNLSRSIKESDNVNIFKKKQNVFV